MSKLDRRIRNPLALAMGSFNRGRIAGLEFLRDQQVKRIRELEEELNRKSVVTYSVEVDTLLARIVELEKEIEVLRWNKDT